MKKHVLLTGIVFLITVSLTAQEVKSELTKDKTQTHKKDQVMTTIKSTNHGQTVSDVAKNTESGPGKGEIVSATAKTNGESNQQDNQDKKDKKDKKDKSSAKNKSTNAGARAKSQQHNVARMSNGKGPGRK